MVNATRRWTRGERSGQAWSGVPRLGAAVLALSLAGLPLAADAVGQQAKKAKASKENSEPAQKDTAGVQRAYAAGTRAFQSGDLATAERELSVALAGGGLPNPQMARALYMRGSAYRQLGRPAQAISDLTTAIWLKNGLTGEDKTKATEARQLAYREAGLGDTPPPIGAAPLDQGGAATASSAPAPAPGAQVVEVTPQGFWSGFSMPSLTGGSSKPAQTASGTAPAPAQESSFWSFIPGMSGSSSSAPQPAQTATLTATQGDTGFGAVVTPAEASPALAAASAPTAIGQTSSWDTQTAATQEPPAAQPISTGYAPAPESSGLNTMPGASPAAPSQGTSWNPLAGTGTAVGNFFGNVFGSGSQQAAAEPSPVTTGSTAHNSNWGADTVVTAQTSSMVQRGPDAPPSTPPTASGEGHLPWTAAASPEAPQVRTKVAAAAPPPAAGGGKYKLQVAAVRSREEAEKLAQTLRSYQSVQNGTVSPEIDEAVIGSMGTFYRVRLGPYADATEPGQLCKTLKPQGFDCLVVTQ
ncbi:SPOR domain-containing protein [Hyphomicrobium sp.]|uniref:SPOR domain-containing protein n=1 Tax=Hyphomicrobium sp. TaxID=82 RepID=UPI002E338C7C|nr:SPOR domain-containing protein [Hyphomicrobium sp.]HEX2842783.1 SPOR domain-containing protein [Hyphomicrobium sp.]